MYHLGASNAHRAFLLLQANNDSAGLLFIQHSSEAAPCQADAPIPYSAT